MMVIKTRRLVLRDFVREDWEAVLRYQRDPRYLRFYPWEDRSEDDVRAFVRMFLDQQAQQPRRKFQLAVTLAPSGELIGNAGVRLKDGEDAEADLGYELSPEHWGHGYATEAARAMLEFGFGELGVSRITASVIADNLASIKVLERLGLRLDQRISQDQHFKGRAWDTLVYAVSRWEWAPASD